MYPLNKKLNYHFAYEILKTLNDAEMNRLLFENGIPDDPIVSHGLHEMTQMGFVRINEESASRIFIELTDQGFAFFRGWDWAAHL